MTKYFWVCNECNAKAESGVGDAIVDMTRIHYKNTKHFDSRLWKE
jgi:hypothetical protein